LIEAVDAIEGAMQGGHDEGPGTRLLLR
jgi:hypothetical protein